LTLDATVLIIVPCFQKSEQLSSALLLLNRFHSWKD
jgi:hypothetical protein